MEQLVGWSRGATGGPVWERFLQEGYVVVVADYRRIDFADMAKPISTAQTSYVDDGIAVVDYVSGLPYVNKSRIDVYGVSLGGNLVLHLIARKPVHAAILGAGADELPRRFDAAGEAGREAGGPLQADDRQRRTGPEEHRADQVPDPDPRRHRRRPDRRSTASCTSCSTKAGKSVRMEVYQKGYHDFCMGPQGHAGRKEPLLDVTLDALEESVKFLRAPTPKPTDPPKTFDLAAIDAYVAAQVRDQGYPGLSLAIVRDGKVVLAKGYGKRSLEDGAPVEPDTPFAVGSVTKQFTCACVLLLAEEGKLSVDDKVAKYFPELDPGRRYHAPTT